MTLFLFSFDCFSQQVEQDSVQLIKKYQAEASDAITRQDFDNAIVLLNQANQLASAYSDQSFNMSVQLEIAELQYFLQNYQKANTVTDKALELIENGSDDLLKAQAFKLKGLVLTRLNMLDDAAVFFGRAESIYTNIGTEAQRAEVLLGMGILQLNSDKLTDAINYYNAAIPVFKENNMSYQLAYSYLCKAEALLALGEEGPLNAVDQAAASLDKANAITTENSFTRLQVTGYRIASQIAVKKGDLAGIERNLALYQAKSDSIQQVYLQAITKGVEIDASVNNFKKIISDQNENIAKQQKSINFGRMTTGLSIALIIILSLLTLSLYKNNNLRAKANELLQDKNIELAIGQGKS